MITFFYKAGGSFDERELVPAGRVARRQQFAPHGPRFVDSLGEVEQRTASEPPVDLVERFGEAAFPLRGGRVGKGFNLNSDFPDRDR